MESLGAGLCDLSMLGRGSVSPAVTPTLAEILLPPAVRQFSKLHPEVRVIIDDSSPDQFVSRVVGEHVDFGLGVPHSSSAPCDLRFKATGAAQDGSCIVGT